MAPGNAILTRVREGYDRRVSKIASEAVLQRRRDVLVLGAGLGGLLVATSLARAGWRALVIERARHPGGRFTARNLRGYEVSTGALHLVPHADRGPLGQMLREVGIEPKCRHAGVVASFWWPDRHVVLNSTRGFLTLFPPRRTLELARLLWALFLERESTEPFGRWLRQRQASTELCQIFEAFAEFALGLTVDDLTVAEQQEIFANMHRYGLPGVPSGGCRAVTDALVGVLYQSGGELWLNHEVTGIETEPGRVSAVTLVERSSGAARRLAADVIVSNLGPQRTQELIDPGLPMDWGVSPRALKVHVGTSHSLISHTGIMLCVAGTERVSGFVQPSNADPHLAPPGHHLVISFQVMRSDNLHEERRLALRDWRAVFGDAFDEAEVIAISSYPEHWPVNWLPQGRDVPTTTPWRNLYLVGDGCKPRGHMMVEGVAASAAQVVGDLLASSGISSQGLIAPA